MADEFHCATCGGIIGAVAVTDAGRPCTCFAIPATSSDTAVMTPPPGLTEEAGATSTATAERKLCCVCGADVTGKKRYRDSKGYWCSDCHKADRSKIGGRKTGTICPECAKSFDEAEMFEYGGSLICRKCLNKRQTHDGKNRQRRAGSLADAGRAQQDAHNVRLQKMIGASALLLMVAMWRWDLLPWQGVEGSDMTDLLKGARVLGLVFLGLMVGVIYWIKRSI